MIYNKFYLNISSKFLGNPIKSTLMLPLYFSKSFSKLFIGSSQTGLELKKFFKIKKVSKIFPDFKFSLK